MAGPTWYYAGPTIHTLLLEAHGALPAAASQQHTLRLIANAAGPLLAHTAVAMRTAYGRSCHVLPSYGMTECMPIASPPADHELEQRPGASGWAVGPEVAIHDGAGIELPTGTAQFSAQTGAWPSRLTEPSDRPTRRSAATQLCAAPQSAPYSLPGHPNASGTLLAAPWSPSLSDSLRFV